MVLEMLVVPNMKERKEEDENKPLQSNKRRKGLRPSLRATVTLCICADTPPAY